MPGELSAYAGRVARWTGEWLSALSQPTSDSGERQCWPGEHLGLPESGAGAAVGSGRRFAALVLDLLAASLVTSLFVRPEFQDPAVMRDFNTAAIGAWALLTVIPVAIFGFTPGMGACGARVGRLDGSPFVGVWRALVRGALTFLIIPAAVRNADSRGWHDRLTGTVVVRFR